MLIVPTFKEACRVIVLIVIPVAVYAFNLEASKFIAGLLGADRPSTTGHDSRTGLTVAR